MKYCAKCGYNFQNLEDAYQIGSLTFCECCVKPIVIIKKPPLKVATLQGRKTKNHTEILAKKGEKVNG